MPTITVRHDPKVQSDITLCYDTFGDSKNPTLLLVCGMNMPLALWPTDFCERLVSLGFYVIRLENRDVGLSVHLDHVSAPSVCCLAICCTCCYTESYTLTDMALDAVHFLDKMNITEKIHLLGQSLGGMLCQIICSLIPDRIASASLLYTSPGIKSLPEPTLSVKLALAEKPKDNTVPAYVENWLKMAKVAFFTEEYLTKHKEWMNELMTEVFTRSTYMGMILRQASAAVKQEDRSEICKKISCPCVVIHGTEDVLVLPAHGEALHKLIPNSKLVMIKGMGHGICPSFFDQICLPVAEIAGLRKPEADAVVEENTAPAATKTDENNNEPTPDNNTPATGAGAQEQEMGDKTKTANE